MNTMNAVTWLKGLAAAVISAVSTMVLSSGLCNVSGAPLSWGQLGNIAAGAALTGAALYLKQSPIPDDITVKQISFEAGKTTVSTTTIPQSTDTNPNPKP